MCATGYTAPDQYDLKIDALASGISVADGSLAYLRLSRNHIDVVKHNGSYYALLSCADEGTNGANTDLWLATSDDEQDWALGSNPLLAGVPDAWDETHIYRACLVAAGDESFDLWYSARENDAGTPIWHIGRTEMTRL